MRKKTGFLVLFCAMLSSSLFVSCGSVINNTGNNGGGGSGSPTAVYVATNGSDANSGTSASSPMLTIQLAISNAAANGYQCVYVAEGYYTTNSGLFPFISNNVTNRGIWITNHNLQIIGGYAQDFSGRTAGHYSILDGLTVIPRGFFAANATNIRIDGFFLTRFNAYNDVVLSTTVPGAAVYMSNVTASTITNVCVSNVSAWNGSVCLSDSHFNRINGIFLNNNMGGGYGGGINLMNGGSSNSINAVILNNTANGGGGGVFISGPYNVVSGSILSNISYASGGGILVNSGVGNIVTNALIACNFGISGGGVYFGSSGNWLTGSVVSNNTVSYYGGGLFIGSSYNTNDSVIIGNLGTNGYSMGGGIYINGANNAILNADILNNTASNNGSGGAICMNGGNDNIISNCLLSNNMALDGDGYGGGMYLTGGNRNLVIGNWITCNFTGYAGGGIVIDGAICRIICNIVSSNSTASVGSAISIYSSRCQLVSNLIVSNGACTYGGLQIEDSVAVTNEYNVIFNDISAIWLRNCNSGLIIRYNLIGGVAYSSFNTGIDEGSYGNSSNHTVMGNAFSTNTLHFLYKDYLGANIVTNNSTWTNINNTNYSGALNASGNMVTNI